MANEPEKWGWQDFVALIVCVVWAISYLAGFFVKDYEVPIEVSLAMLAVMGVLGLKSPSDKP